MQLIHLDDCDQWAIAVFHTTTLHASFTPALADSLMLLSARASRLQGFHVWVLCIYIYIDTCFYMYIIHSISCSVCSNCIICTCYINFHGHMQRSQVAAVSRTSHDASKDAKVLMCSTMACAIDPQTLEDADIIIAGICTYNYKYN